jgi:hypothetical protein
MSREAHVRIRESREVRLLPATRLLWNPPRRISNQPWNRVYAAS